MTAELEQCHACSGTGKFGRNGQRCLTCQGVGKLSVPPRRAGVESRTNFLSRPLINPLPAAPSFSGGSDLLAQARADDSASLPVRSIPPMRPRVGWSASEMASPPRQTRPQARPPQGPAQEGNTSTMGQERWSEPVDRKDDPPLEQSPPKLPNVPPSHSESSEESSECRSKDGASYEKVSTPPEESRNSPGPSGQHSNSSNSDTPSPPTKAQPSAPVSSSGSPSEKSEEGGQSQESSHDQKPAPPVMTPAEDSRSSSSGSSRDKPERKSEDGVQPYETPRPHEPTLMMTPAEDVRTSSSSGSSREKPEPPSEIHGQPEERAAGDEVDINQRKVEMPEVSGRTRARSGYLSPPESLSVSGSESGMSTGRSRRERKISHESDTERQPVELPVVVPDLQTLGENQPAQSDLESSTRPVVSFLKPPKPESSVEVSREASVASNASQRQLPFPHSDGAMGRRRSVESVGSVDAETSPARGQLPVTPVFLRVDTVAGIGSPKNMSLAKRRDSVAFSPIPNQWEVEHKENMLADAETPRAGDVVGASVTIVDSASKATVIPFLKHENRWNSRAWSSTRSLSTDIRDNVAARLQHLKPSEFGTPRLEDDERRGSLSSSIVYVPRAGEKSGVVIPDGIEEVSRYDQSNESDNDSDDSGAMLGTTKPTTTAVKTAASPAVDEGSDSGDSGVLLGTMPKSATKPLVKISQPPSDDDGSDSGDSGVMLGGSKPAGAAKAAPAAATGGDDDDSDSGDSGVMLGGSKPAGAAKAAPAAATGGDDDDSDSGDSGVMLGGSKPAGAAKAAPAAATGGDDDDSDSGGSGVMLGGSKPAGAAKAAPAAATGGDDDDSDSGGSGVMLGGSKPAGAAKAAPAAATGGDDDDSDSGGSGVMLGGSKPAGAAKAAPAAATGGDDDASDSGGSGVMLGGTKPVVHKAVTAPTSTDDGSYIDLSRSDVAGRLLPAKIAQSMPKAFHHARIDSMESLKGEKMSASSPTPLPDSGSDRNGGLRRKSTPSGGSSRLKSIRLKLKMSRDKKMNQSMRGDEMNKSGVGMFALNALRGPRRRNMSITSSGSNSTKAISMMSASMMVNHLRRRRASNRSSTWSAHSEDGVDEENIGLSQEMLKISRDFMGVGQRIHQYIDMWNASDGFYKRLVETVPHNRHGEMELDADQQKLVSFLNEHPKDLKPDGVTPVRAISPIQYSLMGGVNKNQEALLTGNYSRAFSPDKLDICSVFCLLSGADPGFLYGSRDFDHPLYLVCRRKMHHQEGISRLNLEKRLAYMVQWLLSSAIRKWNPEIFEHLADLSGADLMHEKRVLMQELEVHPRRRVGDEFFEAIGSPFNPLKVARDYADELAQGKLEIYPEEVLTVTEEFMAQATTEKNGLRTVLHTACSRGNAAVVKTLLMNGAGVNELDEHHLTPFHVVAENFEIMHIYNEGDREKYSNPNWIDSAESWCRIVRMIITGQDGHFVSDRSEKWEEGLLHLENSEGKTPFHLVQAHQRRQFFKLVMTELKWMIETETNSDECKIRVDRFIRWFLRPCAEARMEMAIIENCDEILEVLVRPDVPTVKKKQLGRRTVENSDLRDAYDKLVLVFCGYCNMVTNSDVVLQLVHRVSELGGNLDGRDGKLNKTALWWAARAHNLPLCDLLITLGSELRDDTLQLIEEIFSSQMAEEEKEDEEHVGPSKEEVMSQRAMYTRRSKLSFYSKWIVLAAMQGHLKRDGDEGRSLVLDFIKTVVYYGEFEEIIAIGFEGKPPLHHAAENGHEATCRLLLEVYNVNKNDRDHLGWSPIMYAIWNQHADVVALLLEKGVFVYELKIGRRVPFLAVNIEGYTPYHLALQIHKNCVEVLEQNRYREKVAEHGTIESTLLKWFTCGLYSKLKKNPTKVAALPDTNMEGEQSFELALPKGFTADDGRSDIGSAAEIDLNVSPSSTAMHASPAQDGERSLRRHSSMRQNKVSPSPQVEYDPLHTARNSIVGSRAGDDPPPVDAPQEDEEETGGVREAEHREQVSVKIEEMIYTRNEDVRKLRGFFAIKTTVKKGWYYAFFIIVLTLVAYQTTTRGNENTFHFTDMIFDTFIDEEFQFDDSPFLKTFNDIRDVDEFFMWLRGPFYLGLISSYPYVRDTLRAVGTARLRQVRIQPNSCSIANTMDDGQYQCYGDFTTDQEETDPFGPSYQYTWKSASAMVSPYPEEALFLGYFHELYPGSGYAVDIPTDPTDAYNLILELQSNNWIDDQTRTVFVDFTVYNLNINLFCVPRFTIEFPAAGGAKPTTQFDTIVLYPYVQDGEETFIAIEILLAAMVMYQILENLWRMFGYFIFTSMHETCCQKKRKTYETTWLDRLFKNIRLFCSDFWNVADMCFLCIMSVVVCMRIVIIARSTELPSDIATTTEYVPMQQLATVARVYITFFATALTMAWLKLFKMIEYVPVIGTTGSALITILMGSKVLTFAMVFAVFLIAFSLSFHIGFGANNDDYRSFPDSFLSILRFVVGDFDVENMMEARRGLGAVLFILYLVVGILVLLSLIIAVIESQYSMSRQQLEQSWNRRVTFALEQDSHFMRRRTDEVKRSWVTKVGMFLFYMGLSILPFRTRWQRKRQEKKKGGEDASTFFKRECKLCVESEFTELMCDEARRVLNGPCYNSNPEIASSPENPCRDRSPAVRAVMDIAENKEFAVQNFCMDCRRSQRIKLAAMSWKILDWLESLELPKQRPGVDTVFDPDPIVNDRLMIRNYEKALTTVFGPNCTECTQEEVECIHPYPCETLWDLRHLSEAQLMNALDVAAAGSGNNDAHKIIAKQWRDMLAKHPRPDCRQCHDMQRRALVNLVKDEYSKNICTDCMEIFERVVLTHDARRWEPPKGSEHVAKKALEVVFAGDEQLAVEADTNYIQGRQMDEKANSATLPQHVKMYADRARLYYLRAVRIKPYHPFALGFYALSLYRQPYSVTTVCEKCNYHKRAPQIGCLHEPIRPMDEAEHYYLRAYDANPTFWTVDRARAYLLQPGWNIKRIEYKLQRLQKAIDYLTEHEVKDTVDIFESCLYDDREEEHASKESVYKSSI